MKRQLPLVHRPVSVIAGLCAIVLSCPAQMAIQNHPPAIKSLELGARTSQAIFRGQIAGFSPHSGASTWDVQFVLKETIKGRALDSPVAELNVSHETLDKWKAAGSPLLVEIPDDPQSVAVAYDLSDPSLVFINERLDLLTKPDQIVQAIRDDVRRSHTDPDHAYSRRIPTPKATEPVRQLLSQWARSIRSIMLEVPIDQELDDLGIRSARSEKIEERAEGAQILGNFKSPQNEAILKKLLSDPGSTLVGVPPEMAAGYGMLSYPVRGAAFGSLRQWDPSLPEPVLGERIDMIGTTKKLLVSFDNDRESTLERAQLAPALEELHVTPYAGTPLDAHQIHLLSQLKQLKELQVSNHSVDDDSLTALTTLTNLRSLALDNDEITDGSVKTLLQFPKLRSLDLTGTRVSYLARIALIKERPHLQLTPKMPDMAPTSLAECRNKVYSLADKGLVPWRSKDVGRLTGPLKWSQSPSGRTYLGPLGQQAVTLSLKNLPSHRNVTVEIDLWMIGSWDGGNTWTGPDIFDIGVPGVGTLLHSSFFNNTEAKEKNLPLQSFPDPYPMGWHKGYTGAAEERTLGFTEPWDGQLYHRDAVYKLHYTFPHTGRALQIVFTGENLPQPDIDQLEMDEHWGLENVVVKTD